MDEMQQAITEMIQERINEGFETYEEMVENAQQVFDEVEAVEYLARAITKQLLLDYYQTQRTWIQPTDCDRLDQAFAELEMRGIIARQNFACCSNCGHGEIWDEIEQARSEDRKVIGYTFYHLQDTEYAAQGHGLSLAFGAVPRHQEFDENVAQEIVNVLKSHGLNTQWAGDVGTRIRLAPFDWKRRRIEEDLSGGE
jgi:hypothetical protein